MHVLDDHQMRLPWPAPLSFSAALAARRIGDLSLPVRLLKPLRRLGIRTVRDLCNQTEARLLGEKNIGPRMIDAIKQSLLNLGLNLRKREKAVVARP